MTDIERDQFLSAQKQFRKVSAEIDEIEHEIEQTRIESHQLENDLLSDPVRSALVPLYADLILLKVHKIKQLSFLKIFNFFFDFFRIFFKFLRLGKEKAARN